MANRTIKLAGKMFDPMNPDYGFTIGDRIAITVALITSYGIVKEVYPMKFVVQWENDPNSCDTMVVKQSFGDHCICANTEDNDIEGVASKVS